MTIDDLIAKVRELAASRPDNVYLSVANACYYSQGECSDGSVGCIFGQALLALGVSEARLQKFDELVESPIDQILEELDMDTNGWCMVVQRAQDDGATWSEAVRIADAASI